ncbi:MAG: hypothetical protein Q7V57_14240 [Actinomycetota bacterium]|nr:hypothetical protein [Actinomycetota bacterium]
MTAHVAGEAVVPTIEGWVATADPAGPVLRSAHGTIAVAWHRVPQPPIDQRAVAARLAAGVRARTPAAAVEFRRRGHLGGRSVAIQVVAAGDDIQLHAVSGDGSASEPLLVAVATCTREHVDRVGAAFTRVIAEVRLP